MNGSFAAGFIARRTCLGLLFNKPGYYEAGRGGDAIPKAAHFNKN